MFDFIEAFGSFWSFSMLGVERIHVMIKKLGKSRRNIMSSIQKNNDLLCQSQLEWRYTTTHEWSNEGKESSLHRKNPVPVERGEVQPKGGFYRRKANRSTFQKIEDEWAISNNLFKRQRDNYTTYVRNCRRQKPSTQPLPFREWQLTLRTEPERCYVTLIVLCN
jgi:hypothetical protein